MIAPLACHGFSFVSCHFLLEISLWPPLQALSNLFWSKSDVKGGNDMKQRVICDLSSVKAAALSAVVEYQTSMQI